MDKLAGSVASLLPKYFLNEKASLESSSQIDFIHTGMNGQAWRVKTANSMAEFIEIFHLRYIVYKSSGYLCDKDIVSRDSHINLKNYLSRSDHKERYGFKYEVDKYDRFDSYVENDFNPKNVLTKHLVALEENPNGPILLDGKTYLLAGYMRVLIDDYNSSQNPIGFTPDSSIDLSKIRDKAYRKNRILHEAGRLVKRKGAHPSMVNGLTKAMVNCTLYGEKYSPDSIMSVRPYLERYYNGLGCEKVSDVFYNNELNEEHILLKVDLSKGKRLLTLVNNPLTKFIFKKLCPKVRVEASHYSIQKL